MNALRACTRSREGPTPSVRRSGRPGWTGSATVGMLSRMTTKRSQYALLFRVCIGVAAGFLVNGCGTPLPKVGRQPVVQAMAPSPSGVLAELEANVRKRTEDQSGFYLVPENEYGMRWRLAMIEHANTSLDLMYFIWQGDPAGYLILDRLWAAADRGVRVRLMVDDMPLAARDRNLAAICLHPNIELKLYNPIEIREGLIGSPWAFLTRMKRANRRMHNKLLVADNRMAVVGGRNVGDEYFGLAEKYNFRDLDVLALGPIVHELSAAFDDYWNAEIAYPCSALSDEVGTGDLDAIRLRLRDGLETSQPHLVSYPIQPAHFAEELAGLAGRMVPGTAWVVQDDPVHVHGESLRLVEMLDHLTRDYHSKEILVSSPYLIPVGNFTGGLARAARDGARVRVLTSSLGSNNHTSAHAHYAKYRRRILATGVELYEFDHEPPEDIRALADVPPVRAAFVSAHMKAIVADRERCFIGSLNLDPRAIDLNTENGLYIESPELGEQLARKIERMMEPDAAWRVHLDMYDRLYWTSDRGRIDRQPARHFGQRIASFFFRLLPIEGQL